MPFPLIPVITAGAGILGQALSGKDKPGQLSPEVLKLIMDAVRQDRSSAYLPDESTYMAGIQSQIDEILAGIPVGQEAFNTDLASRGIFRSGEAPKELYRNVYAPIARAATSAAVQGRIGYENLRFNALSTANQQQLQALQLLVSGSTPQGGQTSMFQDFLSGIGQGATQIGASMFQNQQFLSQIEQYKKLGWI
jgi:hypothetical protein